MKKYMRIKLLDGVFWKKKTSAVQTNLAEILWHIVIAELCFLFVCLFSDAKKGVWLKQCLR